MDVVDPADPRMPRTSPGVDADVDNLQVIKAPAGRARRTDMRVCILVCCGVDACPAIN